MDPSPPSRSTAIRVAAAASGLAFGLLVVLALLYSGRVDALNRVFLPPPPPPPPALDLRDDAIREAVAIELAKGPGGLWDSHADPDVGRVARPGLRGVIQKDVPIDTNAFGMRERDYELPKPEGLVRVVVLGDSFVFGDGGLADDRFGKRLEGFLRERSGTDAVEVLHLGATSWNLVAECSYLRRQLGVLAPDLVVQVAVHNDLDDTPGVRGFGSLASFSPRVRDHADGMVQRFWPRFRMKRGSPNHLLSGLDWESRQRYADAAAALGELARAVTAQGGRYLLLAQWLGHQPMVPTHLAAELSGDQLAYVADAFQRDSAVWISKDDNHWNRHGNERIARLVYGLALQRALLPALDLPAWPEADEEVRAIHEVGAQEAANTAGLRRRLGNTELAASIDFENLDRDLATQVNGGIDDVGLVHPYASILLRNPGATRLRVRAAALGRPELAGKHVSLHVDELPLGRLTLAATGDLDSTFPLPPEVADREHVTIRFEADDYVYVGAQLDRCVAMRLRSVALE